MGGAETVMANHSSRAREQQTLIRLIEGSAIVRAVDRWAGRLERSFRSSRIHAWSQPRMAAIAKLPRDERWRRGGAVLVTAAMVHLALLFARHPGAGWRALVIPAVVATQGVLLLMASTGDRRD